MTTNQLEKPMEAITIRRENHREKILRLLQEAEGGWVPCSTFAGFSRNHTARISELRNLGFDVECSEEDENGSTFYRLVSEGEARGARKRFIVVSHNFIQGFQYHHVLAHDIHQALSGVSHKIDSGSSVGVVPCASDEWVTA